MCGDRLTQGTEQCDDANTNIHDGCVNCMTEKLSECSIGGEGASFCAYKCGDGQRNSSAGEVCDKIYEVAPECTN